MADLTKRVLLIINPCAGKSSKRAGAYDIISCFPSDYEITTEFTKCVGDATRIVKEKAPYHDIVVCCGGDGTLNETINGIMDMPKRVPIGYIPMGTTNDLADTLGLSSDYREAVKTIVDGHMNWYDVGLFNNRYFTYTASFGAFTRSSYNTSQKMKNLFGYPAYFLNGLFTEVKNVKNFKAKVECDQGVFEGEFCFGSVTDSASIGGIFKIEESEVKLDDGKFELFLVRKINNFVQIPLLVDQMRRKKYDGKNILLFHTSKVKITFEEEVDWTVDGEYGGAHKDVITHNLEKAIRIFSPPGKFFRADTPTDIDIEIKPEVKEPREKKEKKERKERPSRKERRENKDSAEETVIAEQEDVQEIIAEDTVEAVASETNS